MTVFTEAPMKRHLAYLRWACLFVTAALPLAFIDRGFDFSDESFHIAWIANPAAYPATITPYGYLLHPIFVAVGRSIIAMRVIGIAALLASGAAVGNALASYYRKALAREDRLALPVLGAICSLSCYAYWILTPGYNLLTNVGAMLVFSGCLGWADSDRNDRPPSLWRHASLVGVGGAISFLGKPTFAAIAAICVAGMLVLAARRNARTAIKRFIVAGALCIAVIFAILSCTVGLQGFVSAITRGLTELRSSNLLKDLPLKTISDFYYSSPVIWIQATFAMAALMLSLGDGSQIALRSLRRVAAILFGLNLVFLAWNVAHGLWIAEVPGPFVEIPAICITFNLLALGALWTPGRTRIGDLLPVLALVLLPFAMSFGSARSIITQTSFYIWATLMAAVIATRILAGGRFQLRMELAIIAGTPLLLVWSATMAYHLPHAIFRQTEPVHFAFTTDTLKVDAETANYVNGLQRVAAQEGLTPATPILDLTGGGPGIALAMNGRAPFHPWLMPGWGYQIATVDAAWASLTAAQKHQAWIAGPIQSVFAETAVAKYFTVHRADYREVGRFKFHYFGRELRPVEIWKPL